MKLCGAVLVAPAHGQGDSGLGLPSSGGHATVLTLHAIPLICFSLDLGRSGEADSG
jgi:hypothetical protein